MTKSMMTLLVGAVFLLVSCAGEVGYTPPMLPIRVGLGTNGQISVSISGQWQTPIGTFDASVDAASFHASKRLLIVRYDGVDTLYELEEGTMFEVVFDEDLFSKVALRHERNGDIFVELRSITASAVADVFAKIEEVWVDFNVTQNERFGMLIHVRFGLYGRKGVKCALQAFFFTADGEPLIDMNDSYSTKNGQVCVGEDFVAGYESAMFDDFELFMPYGEFHVENSGERDLAFQVGIYDYLTDTWLTYTEDLYYLSRQD